MLEVLQRKFASLEALGVWKRETFSGEKFPQHQSQTAAVAALLDGLRSTIAEDLKPAAAPLGKDVAVGLTESRILTAFQIWNIFRPKFAQRLEKPWQRFLLAADELAWLCYEPARTAAFGATDPRGKEPPLIYLSGEASPLIDPRHGPMKAEGVPTRLIEKYGWTGAMQRLPFPLVGMPWYQPSFLPGALAIAHEIGHAVEEDFGLTARLVELLSDAAPPSAARLTAWKKWQPEMFADLWGVLSLGDAYGAMLSAFALGRQQEDPSVSLTGVYPPNQLRVFWTSCVWRTLIPECSRPEPAWWQPWAAPPTGFEPEFITDAQRIAAAWLDATFDGLGGRTLRAVLTFSEQQEQDARDQAKTALGDKADSHPDVRVLWAAVQHAFAHTATNRLLARIVAAASTKPRRAVAAGDVKKRQAHLTQLGASLI